MFGPGWLQAAPSQIDQSYWLQQGRLQTGASRGENNTHRRQYFTQIKYDKIKYLARKSHNWWIK